MRSYVRANFETILAVVAALVMLGSVMAYVLNFNGNPPGEPEDWAGFGDFFGGVINPVIGLVTVILVVVTLKVTRQEANDTREKMDEQLVLMRNDQKRQDIKRRLDGLLVEWNRVMDEKPSGRMTSEIGHDKDGLFSTNRRLMESPEVRAYLRQQRKLHRETYPDFPDAEYVYKPWAEVIHDIAPLVREVDQCCIRYAERFYDSELPEFYRNRIRRAVDSLQVAGYVDSLLAERVMAAKG